MIIELVEELDKVGRTTYYVKLDDVYQAGSISLTLDEAVQMYNTIKENYSRARVEVLLQESI